MGKISGKKRDKKLQRKKNVPKTRKEVRKEKRKLKKVKRNEFYTKKSNNEEKPEKLQDKITVSLFTYILLRKHILIITFGSY